VWVSSSYLYQYDPQKGKFSVVTINGRQLTVPVHLTEDNTGNIWMASHGLARYNAGMNKLDLVIDSFPFIKMPDKQVSAPLIYQNTAWFSSNNNGLIAYNISHRTFRIFTTSEGLPNNNVTSMIIIGDKLWIACFSGVACMDIRSLKIVSFGKDDGFPDMPVVGGANFFYDSASRQLYLSFSNAIARFDPYEILRKKSAPKVFIENLAINGKKNNFLPGSTVTTSWRDNELMLTVGTINFSSGHGQGYAYRVLRNNAATPWQQLGSQSSFSISNLSPGTHRIQVKVFSLNNRWPEQIKEITLVVLPPFWKTDWFIILVCIVVLASMYIYIKWRTGTARKKEMEKTHIEKLKADHYKNQFELEQITNYFSSSMAAKKTEEEVLWDVTHNLIGRMNYVDCMIYLWNEDKTKMVQKASYGPKGKPEFITSSVFDVLPGQGIVGHVMQTRQPLLVNDTRKDDRYRVDDVYRLSEVCVPIIHNDELLGIVDSEHHIPNYFSERDIKILTTIATLIGNKLKQIESDQSLEVKRAELANINAQLAEARLAALQAQMNPHFVFNALNSIKRMILDKDNEKASRYLSKFALMIRMTLNHSKDIFVTLDENIDYLKAYLEMEQLRFDDSFTYTIFTDEIIDTEETSFPSLMIQPLVENAIWHGLMPSKIDKKIMIRFTQSENRITCMIEDNGIGIHQSEKLKKINGALHQSMGLENLQKRIKIMNEKYDTECSLQILDLKDIDKNNRGTRVILQFKLINI
jgi:putative methionine-R-sulfoxide reductase with GAF domain